MEIARTLEIDSFIMAMRRSMGRRGCPKEIWSDNGTNFKGAERELQKALQELDQSKLEAKCTSKGTKWIFNPPKAPHMEGSWEQMVKSVKDSLRITLKERAPRDKVLHTLVEFNSLVEVEALINSNPLTHVSLDHRDAEALTPNHFRIGTLSAALVIVSFDDGDLCLRRQCRSA
jgi:hypothetical protein